MRGKYRHPAGILKREVLLAKPEQKNFQLPEVDGKKYPENILLRLIDPKGKPMVKIGAAENGAGLTLINQSDEGIIMHGHNDSSFIKIYSNGKERVIKP